MGRSLRTCLSLSLSSTLLFVSMVHAGSSQVRDSKAYMRGLGVSAFGSPWLRFGAAQEIDAQLSLNSEAAVRFQDLRESGLLEPRSVAAGDFDEDSVPDLICGYAGPDGGFLTVQRGNPAVIRPKRLPSEKESVPNSVVNSSVPEKESVPYSVAHRRAVESPFLPETTVFEIDLEPDFIASGDFNADGLLDLVVAGLGSTEILFLPGLGDGSLEPVRRIDLPGRLTALKAADVNRPDGLADVVVGVELGGEASLLVFEGPDGALEQEPERISLSPGEVVDIALSDLDRSLGVDIVAALPNEIVIVQGRDRQLTLPAHLRSTTSPRLSTYAVESAVTAVAAGNFIGEKETELAVLLANGELRLLEYSDDELTAHVSRFVGIMPPGLDLQMPPGRSPSVRLTRVKSSILRQDDLVLVSPSSGDLRVFGTDPGTTKEQAVAGELRGPGEHWPQAVLEGTSAPLTALSMRINGDGLDDLVVLTAGGLLILPTQAGVTLTVNHDGSWTDPEEPNPEYQCTQPPVPGWICTIRGALAYVATHPQEGPFVIDIAVSEITLPATGEGFQGAPYIRPLVISAPVTINGNGVVIKGVAGAQWGSAAVGEKSAAFHLFQYGARDASSSTIREVTLDANGPTYGIYVEDVRNITIENCRFGDQGPIPGGITLINTTNSTIQGNEFHNLTRAGLEIRTTSSGIQVLNNYFGADKSGALPAASESNLDIGNPAQSCTIQGNQFAGIADTAIKFGRVSGTATGGAHLVLGNTIGLNPGQGRSVPNQTGIRNSWHPGCTIGGTSPGQANVIAGNTGAGVRLEALSDGTKLVGNLIGTNATGSTQLGNGEDGVVVAGKDLEIGGEGSAGNIIAFNGTASETAKGVWLAYSAGTGNKILGNSIHSNRSLGIGFSSYSDPTPNDSGDADTGPNNKQNYPVLAKVPNSSDIDLTLDSTPNTAFTIQVFANDECDSSGYGEGQTLLDSFGLQTVGDGTGLAFLQGVPEGKFITATATDAGGNTSEFSACAGGAEELKPFVVNATGDDPDEDAEDAEDPEYDGICSTGKKADGSGEACNSQVPGDCECTLRAAIQEANATSEPDRIHFSIPGSAEHSIAPVTELPSLTAPVEIDGTTQPGYDGLPLIELVGQGRDGIDGLELRGGDSLVRGLLMNRFKVGISIRSSGNRIRGNFLGLCHGGTTDLCPPGTGSFDANNLHGVFVFSGIGNVIGGTRPSPDECRDPCNVVSSSYGTGIFIAEGNQVTGNFIGTDRLGRERFENLKGVAVSVQTAEPLTVIGGSTPGEGNLISANRESGIDISSIFQEVRIEGNRIGTSSDGLGNLGNGLAGISYSGGSRSPKLVIGGAEPGAGNRIAYNKVGIEADRPVIALSNEIFLNEESFKYSFKNPLQVKFGSFHTGPVAVQPPGPGHSGRISAAWQAATLTEFPKDTPVIVQLFRSGSERPCEAVELIGSFTVFRSDDSEKTSLARRSVVDGSVLLWDQDWLTATVTVPDATLGTSVLAGCEVPYTDTDGDGFHDGLEEDRDGNNDGISDHEQPYMATVKTLGKNWTVETNAGALGAAIVLGALEEGGTMHANGLLDLVLSNLGSSSNDSPGDAALQGSAVTVTLTPEPDPSLVPVYVNYGPTPEDNEPHAYAFMFDGTTGAEFLFEEALVSQIVLHFVDGERGDHDLQENGVIVTRGGVLSNAFQILYPLQISSPSLFSGVGTSNFSDRSASMQLAHYQEVGELYAGFANPAFTSVEADHQEARLTSEIFDFTPEDERIGWVRLLSDNPEVGGLLLIGGGRQLDGAVPFDWIHQELYFTRLLEGAQAFRGRGASTLLSLVHPGRVDNSQLPTVRDSRVRLDLLRGGSVIASADHELSEKTALQGRVQDLLGEQIEVDDATDVLRATVLEGQGLIGAALVRIENDETLVALNADVADAALTLFSPQVADLPGALFTSIKLVNTATENRQVVLSLIGDSGAPIAADRNFGLGPGEVRITDAGEFDYAGQARIGSLRVEASGPGIVGDVIFGDPTAARWAAGLPLQNLPFREAVFSQVANIPGVLFTGLAFFNPASESASIEIAVYSTSGELTGAKTVVLGPGERTSQLLSELVPSTDGQVTGSIRVTSSVGICAQQLFGDFQATYLSAVPPKVVRE